MGSPNTISYSKSIESHSIYSGKTLKFSQGQFTVNIARVVEVFSDPTDSIKFNKFGGWKGLGNISCLPFINFDDPYGDTIRAKPINRNISRYPLPNELVLIMSLVTKEAQNPKGNYLPDVYYLDVIPVFGSFIGNPCPNEEWYKLNIDSKKEKDEVFFSDLKKIRQLIQPLGDVVIQGRQGSSLRFGKNIPSNKSTPWVAKTPNPIVILSNNQSPTNIYDKDLKVGNEETSATFESINEDGSTIVMMSSHNIGFIPASSNFASYDQKVSIPEKNNIVVKQADPKLEPDKSPQQTDIKTQSKTTPDPIPTTAPVKVQDPPKQTSVEQEDELPEREDLLEIGEMDLETEVSSVGTNEGEVLNVNKDEIKQKSAGGPAPVSVSNISNKGQTLLRCRNAYFNSLKQTTQKAYLDKIVKICAKYKISVSDLETIMSFESGCKFPKGALRSNGKFVALGLIQFTDFRSKRGDSVFTTMQKKFPELKIFADILDVPLVLESGVQSKYSFDQLDMVDYYFSLQSNRVTGADRYALYGCIFYPYIVSSGRIRTDLSNGEDWVLGTQVSWEAAVKIGLQNKGINGGQPISIKAFKNFVDSLFSK